MTFRGEALSPRADTVIALLQLFNRRASRSAFELNELTTLIIVFDSG